MSCFGRRVHRAAGLFVFAAAFASSTSALSQDLLFDFGADWRYLPGTTAPSAPPEAWRGSVFDDGGWAVGPTGIGYDDGDDVTVLDDMEDNYLSVFCRRTFAVANPASVANLILAIDYDDGFIAFINGVEVARAEMGNAGDEYAFDAESAGGHEAGTPELFDLDPSVLVAGDNVIAVQVHNTAIGSSDLSFNARLTANDFILDCPTGVVCSTQTDGVAISWTAPAVYDSVRVTRNGAPIPGSPFAGDVNSVLDTAAGGQSSTYEVIATIDGNDCPALVCINDPALVVLPIGAEWRYFKGISAPSNPSTAWRGSVFDDSAWLLGPTGIGYGDGDDATVLDDMRMLADDPATAGVDESQPGYLSFFTRTMFTIDDLGAVKGAVLEIDYDDGFIAYINGQEVARSPSMGAVGEEFAFDQPSEALHEVTPAEQFAIPLSALVAGSNVIAAQVHNTGLGSSDASFIPSVTINGCATVNGLTCVRDDASGEVTLSWQVVSAVDEYTVTRNGVALPGSPFDGDSTVVVDTAPSARDNVYVVTPSVAGAICPSDTCALTCGDLDPDNLACALVLVGGATQANLSWAPIAGADSIEIEREGGMIATLAPDADSFTDVDVESDEPEDDTDYDVIFNFADGSTCTLSCGPLDLCPMDFTCVRVEDAGGVRAQLQWSNVVKEWESFSILRDGVEIAFGLDGSSTSYLDEEVNLQFGVAHTYTLMPLAPIGEQVACDSDCTVGGEAREIGAYDPPQGGWDYLIDFAAGPLDYNPTNGVIGNLDGEWIRAFEDSWDGSAPGEFGAAPDGPAPGGIEISSVVGGGVCVGDVDALRILDPGNTTAPAGSLLAAFPDAYDAPNNSAILLGLDAGGAGNLLRTGVTFTARWRLNPNSPAYMNSQATGDGAPLDAGRGQIGFYYRDADGTAGSGATAGLAFTLQSGELMRMSTAPMTTLNGSDNIRFRSIWVTVEDPEGDDTYEINVYLNGSDVAHAVFSQTGASLQAGSADFGAALGNYLAIGAFPAGQDSDIEIDYVGYKTGVHAPMSTLCEPSDNNQPTARITAAPGTTLTLAGGSATVTLDASTSDDGDGGTQGLSYQWTKLSGPAGEMIATPAAASTQVTMTAAGTYRFQLRVDDGEAVRSAATAVIDITVRPGGGEGIRFVRGDSDGSGVINLSDGIQILFWSFQGGLEPLCLDAADTDDSGAINLTDPVRIFQWLFLGGTAPAEPTPSSSVYAAGDCGEDVNLEAPDLTCGRSSALCL